MHSLPGKCASAQATPTLFIGTIMTTEPETLEDSLLEKGYVKIFRKILETGFWSNPNDRLMAISLIMMANWKDKNWQSRNGEQFIIKRGELVTSVSSLQKHTGLSMRSTRTSLLHLEKSNFLTQRVTNWYRHIKLTKYCTFQDYEYGDRQGPDKDPTRTRQRLKKGKKGKNNPPISPQGDFELFWKAYPKKIGKLAALRAWNNAKPGIILTEKILKAVSKQLNFRTWREGFIPNPSTWLNQGRWDDEIDTINHDAIPECPKCGTVHNEHQECWK